MSQHLDYPDTIPAAWTVPARSDTLAVPVPRGARATAKATPPHGAAAEPALPTIGLALLVLAAGLLTAWSNPAGAGDAAHAAAAIDAAFVAQWRAAASRPAGADAAVLATLTHLPFRYEGRERDAAAFTRQVVPALFTAPVRRCLATAPMLREPGMGEPRWSLACKPYGFVFTRRDGRWGLAEFFADGEA